MKVGDPRPTMPIDQQELARRLRAARDVAGLTQDQAATAVGIPRPSIAQIEAGKRTVSGLELDGLARLYRADVRDLLDTPAPSRDVVAHFRSDADLVDRPELLDAIADCIRVGRELAALERLAGVDRLPTASYDLGAPTSIASAVAQGAQAADAERRRLGLGEAPIEDIVDLLDANGIRTAALDMPDGISGLTLVSSENGGTLVVANRSHSVKRRTFSFAHEYAHVLLDRTSGGFVTRDDDRRDLREIRANAFAGGFLMPEAGVKRRLAESGKTTQDRPASDGDPDGRTLDRQAGTVRLHDLALLAHDFKVTRLAMANRLRSIRVVSQSEFESLRAADALSGRGVAKLLGLQEPDQTSERDRFGRRFARLGLEAYWRGRISRDRLMTHLTQHAGFSRVEAIELVDEAAGGDA